MPLLVRPSLADESQHETNEGHADQIVVSQDRIHHPYTAENTMPENLPLIELWNLQHEGFYALIVLAETGILYSNQVGGVACNHPTVEGFCVPLPPPPLEEFDDPTRDRYEEMNPELTEAFLRTSGYDRFFDANRDMKVSEAWIPVFVRKHFVKHTEGSELLGALTSRKGFITYSNSD